MNGQLPPKGVPWGTMAVLMLAVFIVSMGFGIVLPLLPNFIERLLGADADPAQIARSTGLLTVIYMLAIFLFAPIWGWISDHYGRRPILLIALCSFSATMLAFSFIENFTEVYVQRLLSGFFAAAVTPVALATVGDPAATETARARRLTFVSLAGVSGFLLEPTLGVFIAHAATGVRLFAGRVGSLAAPLMAVSLVALLVVLAALMTLPRTGPAHGALQDHQGIAKQELWLVPRLLVLAFIVAAGIDTFQMGLALRGKQELGLSQYQIAVMFTECSLVMIIVQAAVFSHWIMPETTRWFIAPALAAMGVASCWFRTRGTTASC